MISAVSSTQGTQEPVASPSVPVPIVTVSMATSKGEIVRILQRRLE